MDSLLNIVTSLDFWKIAFPVIAAVVAWFANERSKLAWEQFKRIEESYKELLRCLKGFYVATQNRELKDQFLHQVNLCWLYAPDAVIKAAYEFLDTVNTGAKTSDTEKEMACGRLVEAIRNDLLERKVVKRSRLRSNDFRHLIAN